MSASKAMVHGFLEAALFAATDEAGSPLDSQFSTSDFTQKSQQEAQDACDAFLAACTENRIDDATHERSGYALLVCESVLNSPQGGHDLFFTAAGHGAGFWDGGWSFKDLNPVQEANAIKELTLQAREAAGHIQGVIEVAEAEGYELEFHS